MTTTSRYTRQRARGVKMGNKRQIVVRLDDDTFDEVLALAEHSNTSVAEQVRVLIEFGLEDVKEGAE